MNTAQQLLITGPPETDLYTAIFRLLAMLNRKAQSVTFIH